MRGGVLDGLVVALVYGTHAHTQVLAQPELGGANQVAHVVDDHRVYAIQVQHVHVYVNGFHAALFSFNGAHVHLGNAD